MPSKFGPNSRNCKKIEKTYMEFELALSLHYSLIEQRPNHASLQNPIQKMGVIKILRFWCIEGVLALYFKNLHSANLNDYFTLYVFMFFGA